MIIEREENWGILRYDTFEHNFSCVKTNRNSAIPYAREPVVLNLDLTMKCNMDCRHCVAKDFKDVKDLDVSSEMIEYINNSPFMVIVITGGEPLLPECEKKLMRLLQEINKKGLIIDTNGTIAPNDSLVKRILETDTLVRISWDSCRPQDEIYFRQVKKKKGEGHNIDLDYFNKKLEMVKYFRSKGINVAIQSVLHKKNISSITEMPTVLSELHIKKWYIQRYIPSYKVANDKNLDITTSNYENVVASLDEKCHKVNIECIAKKDRRHNSVFLLVGEGALYTQGEKPGQKIPLGSYKNRISYFDYVSCSDHCERYYG